MDCTLLESDKMKALFIFGWMLLCSFSSAQVKIGGDPKIIHPHSLLELKSNTKALVLTVVTDLEMQAITPLNGALVFNIDQGCVFFYHQRWMPLCEFIPPTILTPASFQNISDNHFYLRVAAENRPLLRYPQ